MKLSPPSMREEFRGIEEFYASEIAPFLRTHEQERQRAVMHGGLIVIAAAVIAFAGFKFGPFGNGNIQLGIFIAFAGLAIAAGRINMTRSDIASGLLERICRQFDFDYRSTLSRPDYFETFDRLSLMPGFNREHWEDEVSGERDGAAFTLCEAHLKYKSSGKNSSTRTIFHGQLLVIGYNKKFLSETIVKRDAGLFNRFMKPGKGFQRVGIVSSKFEKIFEAWSTDQVEARALLDPLVLERFEELDRLFNGAKLRAAFSDGKLYAALETGDKLNMGSMFKPLEGPARVEHILKEFDLVFDLIDILLKSVDQKLDDSFSVNAVRSV